MTATEPDATGMFDMFDRELLKDPAGGYARLREETPLVRGVMPGVDPAWIVTRYDDVKMVLSDPRFVVDPANVPGMRIPSLNEQVQYALGIPPEYMKYRLARMGSFDGAEHARLRSPVAPALSVRRIAELRPRVEEIVEEMLDDLLDVAEDGTVDLIPHFAHPLARAMLCELVGVPSEDRERWHVWYLGIWSESMQVKTDAWRDVVGYLQALIERRRAEGGEGGTGDLISAVIRVQEDREDGNGPRHGDRRDEKSGRLSDTEVISMIVMLGLTSQQSAHLITNGTLALLTHPDQLTLLRENPELMPRAIHELLRWTTPAQVSPRIRYATEDLEIGGMPVRKGEPVAVALVAANLDPRRYDDPERLDITREQDGRRETHLAFGAGPHYCVGAALTRLEGEVALAALLRRFPDLALAVDPSDLEREPTPFQSRLTTLPVRL
ncbi:MAG: cytochrome P450 family protein [Actinomadura sp.]